MNIYLGSDHAGFKLKNILKEYLISNGYDVFDKGADVLDENDDYPDFILPVAREVAEDKDSRGIVIGGSGQGEAIACNRISGARAVVYYGGDLDIVRLGREHNDANILALGARFLDENEAKKAVDLWLKTDFSTDEKYERRIKQVEEICQK